MPSPSLPSDKPSVDRDDTCVGYSAAPASSMRDDMPLPEDPKTFFQGGLFVLALIASAYIAREVLLPIVLAFILKLLMQPVMRLLARLRVPRMVASLTVILLLLGIIVGFGELLSAPAFD